MGNAPSLLIMLEPLRLAGFVLEWLIRPPRRRQLKLQLLHLEAERFVIQSDLSRDLGDRVGGRRMVREICDRKRLHGVFERKLGVDRNQQGRAHPARELGAHLPEMCAWPLVEQLVTAVEALARL